jgi:hypothetical protein
MSNSGHYSSVELFHGKYKCTKVLLSIRIKKKRDGDRHSLFLQTE